MSRMESRMRAVAGTLDHPTPFCYESLLCPSICLVDRQLALSGVRHLIVPSSGAYQMFHPLASDSPTCNLGITSSASRRVSPEISEIHASVRQLKALPVIVVQKSKKELRRPTKNVGGLESPEDRVKRLCRPLL